MFASILHLDEWMRVEGRRPTPNFDMFGVVVLVVVTSPTYLFQRWTIVITKIVSDSLRCIKWWAGFLATSTLTVISIITIGLHTDFVFICDTKKQTKTNKQKLEKTA